MPVALLVFALAALGLPSGALAAPPSLDRLIGEIFARAAAALPFPSPALPEPEAFRKLSEEKRQEIIENLASRSPIRAWAYLKDAATENGEVVLNVHELAHIVGNAMSRRVGVARGMLACDPAFAYGCFHGVAEEYLRARGPEGIPALVRECRSVVPPTARGNPLSISGCTHGIGHGLLTWEGLDVRAALADCDLLDPRDRPYCYDGVFMEYSFSGPAGPLKDPRSSLAFCREFDGERQVHCARNRGMYGLTETTAADHARACVEILEGSARDRCVESIGFFLAQRSRGDPARVLLRCGEIRETPYRNLCIAAAAGEFIFQEYRGWRGTSAALCESIPEKDGREACRSRNRSVAEQYGR